MKHLNSVIDITSQKISIRKKSFVFKTSYYCRVKAHASTVIHIKCSLPKSLRNGDFISKVFRPFTNYLTSGFLLKFKRGQSYIKLSNQTSKVLQLKGNTAIGFVTFDLVNNPSYGKNVITHFHADLDGSIAFCTHKVSDCHILNDKHVKVTHDTEHHSYNMVHIMCMFLTKLTLPIWQTPVLLTLTSLTIRKR